MQVEFSHSFIPLKNIAKYKVFEREGEFNVIKTRREKKLNYSFATSYPSIPSKRGKIIFKKMLGVKRENKNKK